MKKKFDYKMNNTMKIMLWTLFALLVFYLIAVVMSFVGDDTFQWTKLVFPVIFTALLLVILITFKKSHYTITKEGISIQLSIGKTVILNDHITTMRFIKPTNQLVVCHFIKVDEPRLSLIQIEDTEYDNFVKAVLDEMPHVLYQEIIDDD